MTISILLAPAASGKTTYALKMAQHASKDLKSESLILVPTAAQKYALRSRLAKAGGALGVRIETFSDISKYSLSAIGANYTTLTTPVRYQLLRYVVTRLPLTHYRPLVRKPGFFRELARIIHDLKAAKIWPDDFLRAVDQQGHMPRLHELGLIYESYQSQLNKLNWADESGWAWLAVEALEKNAESITSNWSLLIVDGFDNFTEVLLAMLKILASRVDETIVTLTRESESLDADVNRQVFQRFHTTRENLEERLGVKADPLSNQTSVHIPPPMSRSPILAHLESYLFSDRPPRLDGGNAVALTATPDRATEVRAALRWLKERIVRDNMQPQEVALLARTLTPYESFIRQTAAEFGLPVHLAGKLPLRSNPVIFAVLNLLELVLPRSDADPGLALPRHGIIDAWRSPYFNWTNTQILAKDLAKVENGTITRADADKLDTLARSGRVIGGLEQWQELFQSGDAISQIDQSASGENLRVRTANILAGKFDGFRKLIDPPPGLHSYSEFAEWLDRLLGPDPETSPAEHDSARTLFLQLKEHDQSEKDEIYERDLQALRQLKEILRSIVWVEEALEQKQQVSYSQFFSDLVGLIDATTYKPAEWQGIDKILAADIIESRGLTFRAVAIVGLAEGEFPKTYVEDPFLWEVDRNRLSQTEGVLLDSSIESYEREYFYQAVTRPSEKLFLTRPRLADSGAEWQPSPFWEEIRRLVDVQPSLLTTESVPAPETAASLSELVESLVIYADRRPALDYIEKQYPGRMRYLHKATQNFDQRYSRIPSPHNGDLTDYSRSFSERFDVNYRWSPSSLESYHSCPHSFFVGRVLKLEPRQEPAEGLDAAQLGTIYHHIFEQLYRTLDPRNRTDPEKLLAILPSISRQVLNKAPSREGFRETAWWRETKQEIANNIARSIAAMAEIQGEFVPVEFELKFFGTKTLTVQDGDDLFLLHGVIDRVDRDQEGRSRIIDYKTAGPYSYTKQTLENGDKIQIALYALAARDALRQGEPVDGFYWHIQHAKHSDLTLSTYGPSEAIDVAVGHAWDSVRGARQGYFQAHPPADGCPSYCPAAGFCWNYRPGMWS